MRGTRIRRCLIHYANYEFIYSSRAKGRKYAPVRWQATLLIMGFRVTRSVWVFLPCLVILHKGGDGHGQAM